MKKIAEIANYFKVFQIFKYFRSRLWRSYVNVHMFLSGIIPIQTRTVLNVLSVVQSIVLPGIFATLLQQTIYRKKTKQSRRKQSVLQTVIETVDDFPTHFTLTENILKHYLKSSELIFKSHSWAWVFFQNERFLPICLKI